MIGINTHEIIVVELNASKVADGGVLPNLLKQTQLKINEILFYSSYGIR
ncbi:hypothetical protein BTN50_1842 [Candidatus Enterovibrio altilux]|uniref:Mobile element protein n=1 Tax=Candidatus Enterovibrio altilux TaxID=1927128 RepID=A0A291BB82_9GAMM|nr:hypothetical protein BTN50_1842 [Candidatus Enterovibrio luxaltus]